MNEIHANRLLKLADFLESVPKAQFDIGDYYSLEKGCGMIACVAGWAGMVPEFREAGYVMDYGIYSLHGEPMQACQAFEKFFGTEAFDANITYDCGYEEGGEVTPRQAAARIRVLVTESLTPKESK